MRLMTALRALWRWLTEPVEPWDQEEENEWWEAIK